MNQLRVAPIVEGHGEVNAVRLLLQRVWTEMVGGEYLEVLQPVRQPRSKLITKEGVQKAVSLAIAKLAHAPLPRLPSLVLLLLDSHDDLPCQLGPMLLGLARENSGNWDIASVLAKVEYETWFVAAAQSLGNFLSFAAVSDKPEEARLGKGWIDKHFQGTKYSETVDQPRLTAVMDLTLARQRSPSFDKLCRELEMRRAAQ